MKTVLLVEDSITERESLTKLLQKAGLVVVSAPSVEEAEKKLKQQKPDLIVLDVILPGKSGFEFCRELKGNPDTKTIPIVICSTKDTEVDKMWGNMLGADFYLPKPVHSEALTTTIEKIRANQYNG